MEKIILLGAAMLLVVVNVSLAVVERRLLPSCVKCRSDGRRAVVKEGGVDDAAAARSSECDWIES